MPCGAAGRQGMEVCKARLLPLLPELAGSLLRAWTDTEGHVAGALCLTCMLARRGHGITQPRCAARA